MKITGLEAEQSTETALVRAREKKAELLSVAKEEAQKRGKEVFDLSRLEEFCDTSRDGKLAPVEERTQEYEWTYYLTYPEVMTLEEFARHIAAVNRW